MRKLVALSLALILCLSVTAGALAEITWDSEELSWKQNKEPVTFSLFHNMTWAPMDVWGKDHVSQQVTTDTGISFNVEIQSNDQQLATYVATGSLPDAVFVYGSANIDLMENSEVSYAWDELIEQYAPEFYELLDETDIEMATKEDGHFYTLYTHVRNQEYWDDPTQGLSYGENVISFRQDIMEELGNPEIKTTEDFYNVLKAAKEKHPEIIAYLQPDFNGTFLASCFGVDDASTQGHTTIDDKGNAIWTYSDEEPITNYLKFANKLYREGLLSQEGLTYDQEQAKAAVMAGNVFCWAGQAYDVDQWNEALDAIEGNTAYYVALRNILTVDGQSLRSSTWGSAGFAGFYITKNCKDPARLIQLMEYMRSPYGDHLTQWGVEGLDYEMVNGYPVQYDTYTWKERGDNVWYFQATFSSENLKALGVALKNEKYGQMANLVLDFKPYWHYDVAIAMMSNAESNSYEGDIWTTMDNIRKNSLTAAIVCKTEEECDKAISDYFTAIKNAGLDDYNKFLNDQYQAIKAKIAQE